MTVLNVMLGTKVVLPRHYEVANALGAIVGNVCATYAVDIKPNASADGITGYTVFGKTETKVFQELVEAKRFSILEARNGAHTEAIKRGARGEITTSCRLDRREAAAKGFVVDLGTKVIAQAIGSIGF